MGGAPLSDFSVPARTANYTVVMSSTLTNLNGAAEVFGWALHMHELGVRGRAEHYRNNTRLDGMIGCMGYSDSLGIDQLGGEFESTRLIRGAVAEGINVLPISLEYPALIELVKLVPNARTCPQNTFWAPWLRGMRFHLGVWATGDGRPVLLHGFFSDQQVSSMLRSQPVGTFVVRFSWSSPGALAITHVEASRQMKKVKVSVRARDAG